MCKINCTSYNTEINFPNNIWCICDKIFVFSLENNSIGYCNNQCNSLDNSSV